jgi:hypothetical protein
MIPAPKANELIERLRPLIEDRRPDAFSIARIRRDAEGLLRSGVMPGETHMILGTLDALEFNGAGFFDHFRIAQQLSGSQSVSANFSLVALRCGFVRESVEAANAFFHAHPDDLSVLKLAREIAVDSLQFGILLQVEERFAKLRSKPIGVARERFTSAIARAKHLGISEAAILDRIEFAGAILREEHEPIFSVLFDFALDGRFSYCFGVKCDVDTMCDLNFKMAEHLVDTFDDTLVDFFTICCLTHRGDVSSGRLSDARSETQQ